MTKTELIETLANYFNISDEDGDVTSTFAWQSGCSFGDIDTPWLTLENVVDALEYLCDDEDDEDDADTEIGDDYVVIGAKWFDSTNGNTYCNAKVINTYTGRVQYIGYQYGYDNHYFDQALELIKRTDPDYGYVTNGGCFNISKAKLKNNDF